MTTTNEQAKATLAANIALYMTSHPNYDDWTKQEAIIEAVRLLTDDQGAAQAFVYAIGLDVDLYR